MIVRIVQMSFREDAVDEFLQIFEARKQHIRHFEGCSHLELWQDAQQPSLLFTYSHWDSEEQLNHYRFSEFFKETWRLTKALFAAPAQAWSIGRRIPVD